MAAFEVLALDPATPQIRAPGAGDTYTFPRAVELPLGTANGVLYLNGSKVVTSGTGLVFDSSGNLGLGVTPSAWWSGAKAFQLGLGSVIEGRTGTNIAGIGSNYFINSSGVDAYINTAAATKYLQGVSGDHRWFTAPSGTAGNAISFGDAKMTLDASGNLAVGTTTTTNDKVTIYTATQNQGLRIENPGSGNFGGGLTFATQGLSLNEQGRIFTALQNGGPGTVASDMVFSQSISGALTEFMRARNGNLGLGGSAARATTAGAAVLNIFNGTAPAGTLANGISIYSDAGEAYVMDAAGNATLISPHDAETNEWIFKSKHTPTGKVLRIDVERLLRFVNDHFGLDAVKEFVQE